VPQRERLRLLVVIHEHHAPHRRQIHLRSGATWGSPPDPARQGRELTRWQSCGGSLEQWWRRAATDVRFAFATARCVRSTVR
jgi:hypothetical protein